MQRFALPLTTKNAIFEQEFDFIRLKHHQIDIASHHS